MQQRGQRQRGEARHEGQHLAAEESGLHGHQASSTSGDGGPADAQQAMAWRHVVVRRVVVLHRAFEQPGLAAAAAAGATAGLDGDAVPLGKVEQRCVLPVPDQGAAGALELHLDRGGGRGPRHAAAPGSLTDAGPKAS